MSDATITLKPHPKDQSIVERPTSAWSPLWQRIMLGAVMLISVFMNFYQLGQNGFANLFYAAGVRSMLDSWHNFFFVSYDPGGFVSLDKPALGFWLQTISAKIFGFTAFTVYLPQALAGVFSVLILYHLVRRHFGVTAGLLAALALAISPISVLTNRNNTIDSTLVLCMMLGAWAVLKAAETGKLRWLLMCAVAVGLGYNVKMTEIFLVVPAYGLLYLLAAPRKIWTRIWHLAVALALMLVIALSWSVAVDLTPASQRPYVGSSQDNSEISLALGYNGIERLVGNFLEATGQQARLPPARRQVEAPTIRVPRHLVLAHRVPHQLVLAHRVIVSMVVAVVVPALALILGQPVHFVFLTNLWLVRSSGSYRLRFSPFSPWHGNAVHASEKIQNRCRWFCGEPGC